MIVIHQSAELGVLGGSASVLRYVELAFGVSIWVRPLPDPSGMGFAAGWEQLDRTAAWFLHEADGRMCSMVVWIIWSIFLVGWDWTLQSTVGWY